MAGTKADKLEALLAPVVEALGCELWTLEYLSKGKDVTLRLYIDRAEVGVSLEDCERVSRQVSSVMDVEDPISGEYTLEVSSPGLDRPLVKLSHYEGSVGERIKLQLRMAFEGRRKFQGIIVGIEGDEVVLHVDGEELVFPVESIEKAKVIPTFNN
ncbi:ribosome maturation factor RimP [uncultured Umboniibacter sp.]|uniref:ribosome maturation factor RimP n=1 Tax=uncultured Umboniibacter sp. TaxID=1798917 RepID=UPI0026032DEF|nr:ribosome maturation factor RimP [uncultured Umboniibacter sp.]